MKFFPNDVSIAKEMKELKILKLKDFVTLQNILCVKDSPTNKEITSFNEIFQQSRTARYQNARSATTFQLRKRDFKTEKYGLFSRINKCLSNLNQLQKTIKANLRNIKRYELKSISLSFYLFYLLFTALVLVFFSSFRNFFSQTNPTVFTHHIN